MCMKSSYTGDSAVSFCLCCTIMSPHKFVNQIFLSTINRISKNIESRYQKLDLGLNPKLEESEFQKKLKDKNSIMVKIEFQHPRVENIIKKVSKYLEKMFPNIFIHFIYVTKKLSTITKKYLKNKIEIDHAQNVIYKFTCTCDKSYIGHSSRYIITRIKEHFTSNDSSVFEHYKNCEHYETDLLEFAVNTDLNLNIGCVLEDIHEKEKFEFFRNKFKILKKVNNFHDRKIQEAIFIKLYRTVLNDMEKDHNYNVNIF